MSHSGDEPAEEEVLPDVMGLVPVRSLDQLRTPHAPRERLAPAEALRRFWGYTEFRPLQAEAVAAAMARADSLVVLPTGGGKSCCYQLPAACGAGMVLVVSPLIALMDDQVAAAREAGLRAGALHTNVAEGERRRLRSLAGDGGLDLLYVSPERLSVGDILPLVGARLALIAIDEAHCVSHWGHDFRPEYRQLAPLLDAVPAVPRMALTATATPQVQDDIRRQLGLREPRVLIGHVDRPNLVYRSLPRSRAQKQVLEVIRRHPGEGGIVYAQTRREVERLADALRKSGVDCAAYHAGLPGETRARVQRDFVNEELDVVVATVAFGMGIDRSNVRYVVHANAPKSVEHYQQEAGRAGRDGLSAECVLLWSGGDFATHRALAAKDGPLGPERQRALDRQLRDIGRLAVAPVCRHRLLTEHFGQPYPAPGSAGAGQLSCNSCDVCLGETEEMPAADALVTAQKILSAVWRLGRRCGAVAACDVLLGELGERGKRAGHDRLSVFGLLKGQASADLRAWIDQLVIQGFLAAVEEGVYTFVVVTDAGRALCKGEGAVRLGRQRTAPARGATATASKPRRDELPAGDRPLFDRLRLLRRKLAERQAVPPYLIFTDVTLRALAGARPTTLAGMRAIKGVGDAKLARYGHLFLPVINGTDPEAVLAATAGEVASG